MNSNASLIDQATPGSEVTRLRIVQILEDPKLESVRFAVAFARWEGIGLIASLFYLTRMRSPTASRA